MPAVFIKNVLQRAMPWCALLVLSACASSTAPIVPGAESPRELVYREVNGRALRAYVFTPRRTARAPRSAVLLFHGGGWSAGEPAWTFEAARRFAAAGMVAVPIEYRLSDDRSTPIDAIADVCAAFQWLRRSAAEWRVDSDRVAGYGVSAGGHLVAGAATLGPASVPECVPGAGVRSTPDLLLLVSPALDLSHDAWFERKLLGRATAAAFSPADHAGPTTPPTNVVIGANDTLTPLAGSKRYCDAVIAAGGICRLNVYDGLGHLLTRNLANQEGDYDPDPEAREAGFQTQLRFLAERNYIERVP